MVFSGSGSSKIGFDGCAVGSCLSKQDQHLVVVVAGRAVADAARPRRVTDNWLAQANAGDIVKCAAMVLIVVDASVVLYDLGVILKML